MTSRPLVRLNRRRAAQLGAMALAGLAAPGARPAAARAALEPRPELLRLGLASYSFRKFDLDHALAMTKSLGLEWICLKAFHLPLDSSPEAIEAAARKVRDAGLKLYAGGVITMSKPAEVEQGFRYAKLAGMGTIIAAPTAEMLPAVEQQVRATGIAVAIHNHGPTDKNFPTPGSVYDAIKGLDDRIGLCVDVGHTIRVGDDLLAALRACADRVRDIHIKDVNGATAKSEEVTIGHGIIDIPALLRQLVAQKFTGVVAFEHEQEPENPMPGIAESVGYVRGALAALRG